jgi:hypothetical protein
VRTPRPAATDRALALLDDSGGIDFRRGVRALRARMRGDPDSPAACRPLLARLAKSSAQPSGEHAKVLQAVARCRSRARRSNLLEQAHARTDASRTSARTAGSSCSRSTPRRAAPLLEAELASERDPLSRIDLIEAVSALASDEGRTILLDFVQSDSASPLEIVYASERLTVLGPAKRVAPVLKRVALRTQDPAARRALQCLLWRAYPGPR